MVMQHSKEALNLLIDQWLDSAEDLWPASRNMADFSDMGELADAYMAMSFRRCAFELRALVKEML